MSISTGVAVGAAIAAANASNGASGHTELSQGGAVLLLAILAVSVAVGAIVGRANYASDRELGLAAIYGVIAFATTVVVMLLLFLFVLLLGRALSVG